MIKELPFKKEIILDSETGLVYNTLTKRYIGAYDNRGYLQVGFNINGKNIHFKVHRLIYQTFVGEIPEGYEIDHIDGDRTNNRLSNLRCVTHKENCNNPITIERFRKASIGKIPPSPKGYKRTEENIHNISRGQTKPFIGIPLSDNEPYKIFFSTREAKKQGFLQPKINQCCHGKRNKHKNYKWFFFNIH